MQLANASICAIAFACAFGSGAPPFGANFLHDFIAFCHAGPFGSNPVRWPLLLTLPVTLIRPFLSGSGKSATPWARMQEANAAGSAVAEVSDVDVPVVPVVPTFATPAAGDEPPQAEA